MKVSEPQTTSGHDEILDEAFVINEDTIESKMYSIRGQRVMLDFDLAAIYGYSTKRFNEQVKNNIEKFEDDFRFQLTDEETRMVSRSKNSTLNNSGRGSNFKYSPYAFTEQGIYMLMTVLRGDLATQQSKALIRTFKRMKDCIIENQELIGRREYLQLSMQTTHNMQEIMELRTSLDDVENQVAGVVGKLGDVVTRSELSSVMLDFGKPTIRRGYFLVNGNPTEANLAYSEIYEQARESVFIVDNYIGVKTLVLLKNVREGVQITVFSDNKGRRKLHQVELDDFKREYPMIDVELKDAGGMVHDRYIMLDYNTPNEKLYHCGASSKDAGERATTIEELGERKVYHALFDALLQNRKLALP